MISEIHSAVGHLRTIKPEELPIMLSWRNAPTVRANMYTRHEISLSEHLSWWNRVQDSSDQKYFMYEIDSVPSGIVAFNGIDEHNRNSSWAFYASPSAPRGTGGKMEYLAIEYSFHELGLHKLCCEVLAFNVKVIGLHEKFGFKVEGVLRDQHRINDAFVDVVRLGMLAAEWSAKSSEMLAKVMGRSK